MLGEIPFAAIVATGHPLLGRPNLAISQLADYPFIFPTHLSPLHPLAPNIRRPDNPNGIIEQRVTCSNYPTLKAILQSSQSWLVTSERLFREELERGELATLDVRQPVLRAELCVMEMDGRARSPAAQAFLDICKEQFENLDI